MLTITTEQQIESFIVTHELIDKAKLTKLKAEAKKSKKPILQYLVEKKALTEADSVKINALVTHTPYADLRSKIVAPDVLNFVPKETAMTYMAVPFELKDGVLNVGMIDPTNLQAIDFLTRRTGHSIKAFITTKADIDHILAQYKNALDAEVVKAISADQESVEARTQEVKKVKSAAEVQDFIQDAPITRALNSILEYAVNSQASDIHVEPRADALKIRFRVDGMLQDTMTLPKNIEPALISRIKIMSNLKIDEHRIPQDGQAGYKVGGREVDLRIAIAPITYGEQVVIRILDKDAALINLDVLGFRGRSYRLIKNGTKKPHGMILSTGPTGSGKSTTLYAVIQEIKNISINIVTLEDPVEYKMEGINQIQVNPAVGLTFANGLRSILRQDPNVVMVGEIRDHETADLAVQAALTGHTVLSTLHTNSASGVLPRLLDMQIEPFLIASTVNTVIGQRLVRKICDNCKAPYQSSPSATLMINNTLKGVLAADAAGAKKAEEDLGYKNLPLYSEKAYTLYKGAGCDQCVSGYKGRTGIYEVFEMNAAMEKLLVSRATTTAIQEQAQRDGMLTMKQDGLLKVLTGVTTIEEVARVASDY